MSLCTRRDWMGLLAAGLGTGLSGCQGLHAPAVDGSAPPALPLLRLPPAALTGPLQDGSQRLTVWRLGHAGQAVGAPQVVDVQLQLDTQALLLAAFALGQRVLLMRWDGRQLQVQRHPLLPAQVDTNRMLRDLVLVHWPAEAVRAALPPGWTWTVSAERRTLAWQGQARLTLDLHGVHARLDNLAEGYRLEIETQAEGSAEPSAETPAGPQAAPRAPDPT